MSREAFEKWAKGLLDLQHIGPCYGDEATQTAFEAWQAALQSGEPVAEIQEYKHWLFCDNGERRGFEWRKRQVDNGDLLSLPHGTKLYTASQPVVDADMLLNELSCLYWSAYNKGHNDTVEACYADVHTTDRFYYWMDQVKEIASEGDVPVVNALLRATVKDSLTVAPQLVVPEAEELARMFHETYESLAEVAGYETRLETRSFNLESPNGRLMVLVCAEIRKALLSAGKETV